MKLPRSGPEAISQVIHAPVNGAVAFFVILAACALAGVALRVAPSIRDPEPFALKPSQAAKLKPRGAPLPPGISLAGSDTIGTPIPLGEFYVGVYVESVDPALISQLKIDGGLVVRHVVPNSPAEAAGVKPNDVMMRAGEAPLKVVCDLGIAITKNGPVETQFDVLREGAAIQIAMTPAKRPSQMWEPPAAETVSTGGAAENQTAGPWLLPNAPSAFVSKTTASGDSGRTAERDAAKSRIEELEKELAKAREEMKSLKEELAKKDARQTERQ
jgi:hypothetical protein